MKRGKEQYIEIGRTIINRDREREREPTKDSSSIRFQKFKL